MGHPIFIRAFWKVKRVLDCGKSNLFHSNIADGKNEYLKISVQQYDVATSSTERVLYM